MGYLWISIKLNFDLLSRKYCIITCNLLEKQVQGEKFHKSFNIHAILIYKQTFIDIEKLFAKRFNDIKISIYITAVNAKTNFYIKYLNIFNDKEMVK